MNGIFLSNSTQNLQSVYPPELVTRLQQTAGADPRFYTKADVLSQPCQFCQTRFIFSTWGMPRFTEEELAAYFPRLEAVFYAAGSVQPFAKPFLNRGVRIFSAWVANAVPVAEFTLAQILLANKGYFSAAPLMTPRATPLPPGRS